MNLEKNITKINISNKRMGEISVHKYIIFTYKLLNSHPLKLILIFYLL